MRFAFVLALLAGPAFAQDGVRSGDVLLDRSGMESLLIGRIVEFHDGSKSTYEADGTYGYTYTDGGPVWSGRYNLFDDSRVCVDFDNGSARCDFFVIDGERAVLITADGTRFPVRNQSVAPD